MRVTCYLFSEGLMIYNEGLSQYNQYDIERQVSQETWKEKTFCHQNVPLCNGMYHGFWSPVGLAWNSDMGIFYVTVWSRESQLTSLNL